MDQRLHRAVLHHRLLTVSLRVPIKLASSNFTNLQSRAISFGIQHIIIFIMIKQWNRIGSNISWACITCIKPARHTHQKHQVSRILVSTVHMIGCINCWIPIRKHYSPAPQHYYKVDKLQAAPLDISHDPCWDCSVEKSRYLRCFWICYAARVDQGC